MRVRFVGSGDAFGSGGRWQTCIQVSGEGQVLLVDCGATSLVALKAAGLDPNAVDAVAVTHLHGDHFGGLPFLILDGQFSRRRSPLLIAGPPGIRTRLTEAMEALFPGSSQVPRRFGVQITELRTDGEPAALGAATVRGWEVEHACGAPPLALRVELAGRSFAYSGDTQWTPALADAAREADLFAAEAYTFDRPVRYHLDYLTLRAHLGEIGARRTVLTHMSAAMLARLADAETAAAHDGMTVDLLPGQVQAEEPDRVAAGDLGDQVLAEVAELERGLLAGARPGAVLVRVVGLEGHVVHADLLHPTASLKKQLVIWR
jgi:ribonuclease BN (tRNA processing enzyme)